ncbi:MAG: hypothetical protein AAF351_02385 [Pseudomonadota bacterium]
MIAATNAYAYETDQFSHRDVEIADSRDVLNGEVNRAIQKVVNEWNKDHADELAVVYRIYTTIGGRHWVDILERWAMKSDRVDKHPNERYDSIYSSAPIYAKRVIALFGVGRTIKLNGVHMGTDKIGHFLSQGRKYYKRWRKSQSESDAAQQSHYTERAIFGQLTTGTFSNADLVSNYEGHRFYRSLFEDSIIPGKPAILRWEDKGWVIQREFDWADHVNDYWDEALNVNHFDGWLYKHMRETLLGFCSLYHERPELWVLNNEAELKARYAHLELRDTSELRLSSLCVEVSKQEQ